MRQDDYNKTIKLMSPNTHGLIGNFSLFLEFKLKNILYYIKACA